MRKIICAEARKLDLVDYLEMLGYTSKKIQNQDYWYLSPLREERTASFKVNRSKNVWFDFGTGQGGDFIDFGVSFHRCSVTGLLHRLAEGDSNQISLFHPHSVNLPPTSESTDGEERDSRSRIVVQTIRTITNPSLLDYLDSRSIPLDIAQRFCQEVDFQLYGKMLTAIGFPNDSGGFELRSPDFKGSNSPKTSRFIDTGSSEIAVFEGFFNFLAFQTINKELEAPATNCLILNSLAFFKKSREQMEKHKTVQLFLDRDQAGQSHTIKALQRDQALYVDNSPFYHKHPDLNDWLIANRQKFELTKTIVQKPIIKQIKIKHHGRI